MKKEPVQASSCFLNAAALLILKILRDLSILQILPRVRVLRVMQDFWYTPYSYSPGFGFYSVVCVCTVLGHERRGSLPSTCYCNFTCQVTSQFSAGGSGPLKSPLPTKLLLSWEDIQADHLDVPAKTTPVWQIRKTAPVREIRRPASHNSFQSNMNMSVGMSGFAIIACV